MGSNPLVGVVFHWLGGLAAGSFYVPYRKVRKWAWETYWLVGGFFSWIIAPWVLALLITPHLLYLLTHTSLTTLGYMYLFGALWGIGGLTFGLTMRYLGMSLGMAVALGFCAAFGTLVPPLFEHTFATKLLDPLSGRVVLLGVAVCLVGIAIAGAAGISKEREMPAAQKTSSIAEFNFNKGMLVAVFSGIFSACMAFGLDAGKPMKQMAVKLGTGKLWDGLPVLIVVLLGGFTSNFIWCVFLNIKNRTGRQYLSPTAVGPSDGQPREQIIESAFDAPGEEMARQIPAKPATAVAAVAVAADSRVPLAANYLFSALAGTIWYFQFFFYTMGESQMGRYKFSSWTLHMASIIIFSTLWGLALREWKGSSRRTYLLITLGLATLVGSTVIIGYGTYLSQQHPVPRVAPHALVRRAS